MNAVISSLPEELLAAIIELAVFESVSTDRGICSECVASPNIAVVKALSLVSRRFSRIAQPHLLHTPLARHEGSEFIYPRNSMTKLKEALSLQETLCSRVKVLNLRMICTTAPQILRDIEAAAYIIRRLVKPSCLAMEINESTQVIEGGSLRALVEAVSECLPSVNHIQVAGTLEGPSWSRLLKGRWANLARLDLRDMQLSRVHQANTPVRITNS